MLASNGADLRLHEVSKHGHRLGLYSPTVHAMHASPPKGLEALATQIMRAAVFDIIVPYVKEEEPTPGGSAPSTPGGSASSGAAASALVPPVDVGPPAPPVDVGPVVEPPAKSARLEVIPEDEVLSSATLAAPSSVYFFGIACRSFRGLLQYSSLP